jgi:hypothetical protein
MRTDGQRFLYQGRAIKLTGYTFYPALYGGTAAWRQASFDQVIDHLWDIGALAGQNLARPTDFWDKTNTSQNMKDPMIWSHMDHLVTTASRSGGFVLLDLSAYKWLLMSQGRDPYDAANWIEYLDFVGARYRTASSIAFYSIVGEPPPPTTPDAAQALVNFYRSVTDELYKADGGHHLIAAGGFNHMEDETPQAPWWHSIFALPHNDVIAFKTYSQHDIDLMPAIAQYARQLNKPMVDEEFGMPQYMGDATYEGGSGGYNGIYTSRSQFFDIVYSEGERYSVSGFVFWNLGCEMKSTGYEVSPLTPAVWKTLTAHAARAPSAWMEAAPPC